MRTAVVPVGRNREDDYYGPPQSGTAGAAGVAHRARNRVGETVLSNALMAVRTTTTDVNRQRCARLERPSFSVASRRGRHE